MSAAAIVAVIHDIIFTVGVYALFQFQVTPATVTAFLTILGFSLYDTVVVFDKVSEYQRTLTATGRSTYGEMVNRSLNAVLMRSLSTSLVALLPVVSLLIVGSRHLRRDRARGLRPRARGRSVHRFVLVDLRRRAAAGVVEGAGAAVPGARRTPPPGAGATSPPRPASVGVPVVAPDDAEPTRRRASPARSASPARPPSPRAHDPGPPPPTARPQAQVSELASVGRWRRSAATRPAPALRYAW